MARNTVKVYDKDTRKWVTKNVDNTSKDTSPAKTKSGGSDNKSTESTATDPKSAKGKAKNKKKKIEYYTLSGSVNVLPTSQNIKIQPSQTISLQGFGKWLTGKYYVASVTRRIDGSAGYSETLEVFKPNFRQQIKQKTTNNKKAKSKNKTTKKKKATTKKNLKFRKLQTSSVRDVSAVSENVREGNLHTYVINSTGDTLWNIAKRYYGDSSKWKRLYDYNTGETPDPLNLVMGMKIVIP